MSKRYYTWDGVKVFTKIETAALYCVDYDKNPYDLSILENGDVSLSEDWEVDELLAHCRDLAPPF